MKKTKIVDFWAPWCGPCQLLAPILKEIEEQYDNVDVEKINVDTEPAKAKEFNIRALPTLVIYRDDVEVARIMGMRSKKQLVELLEL